MKCHKPIGNYVGGFDREKDWEESKSTNFVTKLEDNVSTNNYSLYESKNTYWLCKDLEYLGHIQYKVCNTCGSAIFITESFSKVKGFYSIMFLHIFKNGITTILSDNFQSEQAKGSWVKLLNGYDKRNSGIYDIETNSFIPQDKIKDISIYWGKSSDYLKYRAYIKKSSSLHKIFEDITNRRFGLGDYENNIYCKLEYPNNIILDRMLYTEAIEDSIISIISIN
jgi:hypothetical protein